MTQLIERRHPATLADLERLPESARAELIDGTLYTSPAPGQVHHSTADAMQFRLESLFHAHRGRHGGWWILAHPVLALGPDQIVVPDFAGWPIPGLPDGPKGPRISVAPSWVAELRTAVTASHDALLKAPLYLKAGVRWLWIVDPEKALIEIYAADGDQWRLDRIAQPSHDSERLPPFDAVPIDVSGWFER
jgi:Uma2 family endonuclease